MKARAACRPDPSSYSTTTGTIWRASKELIVNPGEAETVRLIFSRYFELCSLPALQLDLRERGIVTRRRTLSLGRVVGGNFLTIGPLAYLLRNRVYLGEINHRAQSYPGEHEPIIDPGLFESVQAKLSVNRQGLRQGRQSSNALLLGKLFDDRGKPMTPSYAIKKGVRYRYSVSCVLAQGRRQEAGSVARVVADAVEQIILDGIRDRDPDPDAPSAAIAARIGKATLGARSIELQLVGDGEQTSETIAIPWSPGLRSRFAASAP